jgi:hypothetical protein
MLSLKKVLNKEYIENGIIKHRMGKYKNLPEIGIPSFSLSMRSFLSATISPVFVSRARYTIPYVPSPILETEN